MTPIEPKEKLNQVPDSARISFDHIDSGNSLSIRIIGIIVSHARSQAVPDAVRWFVWVVS